VTTIPIEPGGPVAFFANGLKLPPESRSVPFPEA